MSSFIPTNFLSSEAALDKITEAVTNQTAKRDRAVVAINEVQTALQELAQAAPVGWAELVTYVNNAYAADPTDEQWRNLKGRMDKIVADFVAERQATTSMITKINS